MAHLPVKAISNEKLKRQADDSAATRYRRRMELDQRLADLAHQRELKEVWE
jgi:hypothetical protein